MEAASRSRRPPASARCRPSCSRSTARIINGYLGRTRGGKVSFTHLIGYAVVRAIADTIPVMNSTFVEGADGKPAGHPPRARRPRPRRRRREDATARRTLLVPCISDADTLDFRGVLGGLRGPHPQGPQQQAHAPTTSPAPPSRLTNPGTIGTVQSVPRLMPGQGVIVGVGALDYPTEFQGADPHTLADLGVSKVITIIVDLRPPHHPGRRVGPVPQAGARAAARRRRLLRRRSSGRSACPTRPCSGAATSTRSTSEQSHAREADAGRTR